MSDEEKAELLGRAADCVNSDKEAHDSFLLAMRSGEGFLNLDFYYKELKTDLDTHFHTNAGWWYGRLTVLMRLIRRPIGNEVAP